MNTTINMNLKWEMPNNQQLNISHIERIATVTMKLIIKYVTTRKNWMM